MMNSVETYNLYKESEEEFSSLLRMEFRWDDFEYQSMIKIIRNIFRDYQDEVCIPKTVIYFFTGEIDFIVGVVSNEVFFVSTPDGYTRDEYRNLVLKRKSELLELKRMFFSGDFHNLSSHSFFI